MKYDFDSYFFYESSPQMPMTIRFKVVMKDAIRPDILRIAAHKAFLRFPYYSKAVHLNEEGAYILESSDAPICVFEDPDTPVILGSEQTNGLFFCITYKGRSAYFCCSHSFCGGCGAMFWIKATLWQYLKDLTGHGIEADGVITAETPILSGETAVPDADALPHDEPLPVRDIGDSYVPIREYMNYYRDPSIGYVFIPIIIEQQELMKYARANDGSPNSILSAVMFKALSRLLPEEERISAKIACNYRADVGCPDTYHDMVRMLRIGYTQKMSDWPIEKLSTITRTGMYLQTQPEISWKAYRKLMAFRDGIDSMKSNEEKKKYALANSPIRVGNDTFTVSYAGNAPWGGIAEYVESVNTITPGHLMLEVNSLPGKFCITFQQIGRDRKYLEAFLKVLDEEKIGYRVGDMEDRKIPGEAF